MAKLFKPKLSDPVNGDCKAAKAAHKVSRSIFLIISLPVLYASLLHVPPTNLFHDTTFWFLMSNAIIIIIANDSGFLYPPSTDSTPLYDDYVKHSKARSAGLPSLSATATEPQIDVAGENEKYSNSPAIESPFSLTFITQDKRNEDDNGKEKEDDDEEVVYEPLALVIDRNESSVRYRGPDRSRSEMGKRGRTVFENERPLRRSATEMKERGSDGGGGEVGDQYWNMSNEELNKRVEDFIRRFKQIRLEELRRV